MRGQATNVKMIICKISQLSYVINCNIHLQVVSKWFDSNIINSKKRTLKTVKREGVQGHYLEGPN